MVLDLPHRVPGLAGKISLYAEVRLPCPSQYLSTRLAGGHTNTCCEQKQINTLTDQTAHLVKGRIIHQQLPVWPTYLKNPLNAISIMRIRNKCDRRMWEIGFCSSHIQQTEYTCTHTLLLLYLTDMQPKIPFSRAEIYCLDQKKKYSASSDFNPSLKETPTFLNQWDTLHGFRQSHCSLFPAVHANTGLITFISDVCALGSVRPGIPCSFTTQNTPALSLWHCL